MRKKALSHTILKFGLLITSIMLLIEISQYSLLVRQSNKEWVIAIVALLLIFTGVYFGKTLIKPSQASLRPDKNKIKAMGISSREMEVLEKMALGKSNKEIANDLFISESTVKSHVSNILTKLNAKRRTEAIKTALNLKLISDLSMKT